MRDTTRGILLGIVGTLALVGAGALIWWVGATRGLVLTDGARIRVPAADAPVRDVLWEPADLLPAWINGADETYEPHLSTDASTLLLVRGKAGGGADLYAAHRTPHGWSDAFPLTAINTDRADELGPRLTGDGSVLYFYSDREGGQGGYDLWRVRRTDDPSGPLQGAIWSAPENLGPLVNSPYNDYGPAPTPDGTTLFFASNRPRDAQEAADPSRSWPATVREDQQRRDYDLYAAPLTDRGPGLANRVEPLSSEFNEGTPAVSPAGDFVYFASDRPSGAGGLDLYRARLRDGRVLDPEPLGWPVNTAANELDPALSMHGFALHFSSNRPAGTTPPDGPDAEAGGDPGALPARYAIYSTVSREVFPERDPLLAGFDWNAAWGAVWPWLLLLALLALLLFLLRRLLRDEQMKHRWRTLSLLAKCLILSLMLHALLAALFTVWYVAGSVGDIIRRSGGTRVALVSRAVGGDLASQIRGGLTDLSIQAQPVAESRATPSVDSASRVLEARFDAAIVATADQPLARLAADPANAAPVAPHPPTSEIDPATLTASAALATPASAAAPASDEAALRTEPQSAALAATDVSLPLPASSPTLSVPVEHIAPTESPLAGDGPRGATPAPPPPPAPGVAEAQVPAPAGPSLATPVAASGRTAIEASLAPTITTAALDTRAEPSPGAPGPESVLASLAPTTLAAAPEAILDRPGSARDAADAAPSPNSRPSTTATLAIEPPSIDLATSVPQARADATRVERSLAIEPTIARPLQPTGAPVPLPEVTAPITSSITPDARGRDREAALPAPRLEPALTASTRPELPPATASLDTPISAPSSPVATPASIAAIPHSAEPQITGSAPGAGAIDPSAGRPALASESAASPAMLDVSPRAAAITEDSLSPREAMSASIDLRSDPAAPPPTADVALGALSESPRVALPAPAAGASTPAESPAPRPSPTDPMSPTRPRPAEDESSGDAAPVLLAVDPVAARPEERSLPSTTDADDRRPAPVQATRASMPIDLSTLPIPSLALPQATPEAPASATLEPIGTLSGLVRDEDTGQPITGARIRLDLPDAPPIVARTNSRGQYRLRVPAGIPDNVAISAVAPGYTPVSINVAREEIERAEGRGEPLARDFDLSPLAWDVVPIEQDPQVHHLGNDEFEGAINSQFQRTSEGLAYLAEFVLGPDQAHPAIRAAELLILAKGAQADNPIRINGRELDAFIVGTPGDGSFGELIFRIPPRWLREGTNTIEIFSVRGSNDLDDFEFVNPRLRLRPSELRDRSP